MAYTITTNKRNYKLGETIIFTISENGQPPKTINMCCLSAPSGHDTTLMFTAASPDNTMVLSDGQGQVRIPDDEEWTEALTIAGDTLPIKLITSYGAMDINGRDVSSPDAFITMTPVDTYEDNCLYNHSSAILKLTVTPVSSEIPVTHVAVYENGSTVLYDEDVNMTETADITIEIPKKESGETHSDSYTYHAVVTDTAGGSMETEEASLIFYPYTPPFVTGFSAMRSNPTGEFDPVGTTVCCTQTFTCDTQTVADNTVTAKVATTVSGSGTWENETAVTDGSTVFLAVYPTDTEYDVRLVIEDNVGETQTVYSKIGIGKEFVYWDYDRQSVGFGAAPDENQQLRSAWNAKFDGDVKIGEAGGDSRLILNGMDLGEEVPAHTHEKSDVNGLQNELSDLSSSVTAHGSQISQANSEIEEIQQHANELDTAVEEAQGDISTLKTTASTQWAKISTLETKALQHDTSISNLNDGVAELNNDVTAIDAKVETARGNIGTLTSNYNTLNSTVNTINGKVTDLTTNVSVLNTAVSSMDTTITNHATQISGLSSRVTTATNLANAASRKADAVEDTVNDLSDTVAGYDDAISGMNTKVNTLNTKVNAAEASVNEVKSTVNTHTTKIAGLEGRMTSAEGDISTLETDMSTAKSDINAVKNRTSALETKMTKAEGDISDAKSDISDLSSDVETVSGSVSSISSRTTTLEGKMTAAEGSISSINTKLATDEDDISTLKSNVSAAEGDISTLQGDVSSIDGRVDTAESDISSIQGRMTTAEGNITTAEGNITTLQGKMTTAEGKVSTLEGKMSSAETNISTLQSNVSTINGQITALDGDIDDVEVIANAKLSPSDVTMTGTLSDGVKIGQLNVGNTSTDILAPNEKTVSIMPVYLGDYLSNGNFTGTCCVKIGDYMYAFDSATYDNTQPLTDGHVRKFSISEDTSWTKTFDIGYAKSCCYDSNLDTVFVLPMMTTSSEDPVDYLCTFDSSFSAMSTLTTPTEFPLAVSFDPVAEKTYCLVALQLRQKALYELDNGEWQQVGLIEMPKAISSNPDDDSYGADLAVYDGRWYISSYYGQIVTGKIKYSGTMEPDTGWKVSNVDSSYRWIMNKLYGIEFTEDGHLLAMMRSEPGADVRDMFIVELPVGVTAPYVSSAVYYPVYTENEATITPYSTTAFYLADDSLRSVTQFNLLARKGNLSTIRIDAGDSIVDDYEVWINGSVQLLIQGTYTAKCLYVRNGNVSLSGGDSSSGARTLVLTTSSHPIDLSGTAQLTFSGGAALTASIPNRSVGTNFVYINNEFAQVHCQKKPACTQGYKLCVGNTPIVADCSYSGQNPVYPPGLYFASRSYLANDYITSTDFSSYNNLTLLGRRIGLLNINYLAKVPLPSDGTEVYIGRFTCQPSASGNHFDSTMMVTVPSENGNPPITVKIYNSGTVAVYTHGTMNVSAENPDWYRTKIVVYPMANWWYNQNLFA